MTDISIWILIIGLGLGTFAIRFSFLGLIGDREIPKWFRRSLRYVGVAVLPALVAPFVLWPAANEGITEPARLLAALAALVLGIWFKNTLVAAAAGFAVLYLGLAIF